LSSLSRPPTPTSSLFPYTTLFRSILRSPCTACVIWKSAGRQGLPDIKDRIDNTPTSFDHVGALEQGGVSDHAVIEQNLITGIGGRPKIFGIFETHVHRSNPQDRARNLRAKTQGYPLHRLDLDHECVCVQLVKWSIS